MDVLRITPRNRTFYRAHLALKTYQSRDSNIRIARGSKLTARTIEIGRGTRINGPMIAKGSGALVIGRYCAIGHDVKFITNNHSVSVLNLNQALQDRLGAGRHTQAERDAIQIGHNVWIGDNVIILPGVRVGNGAVIGAGAVVAKSIEPFQICVGNPARVVRSRFSAEAIQMIEESRWWERAESEMRAVVSAFEVSHVDEQIEAVRRAISSW